MPYKTVLAIAAALFPAAAVAQNAIPPALRGKSFVLSWTDHRMARIVGVKGGFYELSIPIKLELYMGTKGSVFARASTPWGHAAQERVGLGQTAEQPAAAGKLVGRTAYLTQALIRGAVNIRVDFDESFSRCTLVSVVFGKPPSGENVRLKSALGGAEIEVESSVASRMSCTVQEGNVLTR
jgi:hypothetical protein